MNTLMNRMLFSAGLFLLLTAYSDATAAASKDPALIVGPDECGECHKLETQTWKETKHALAFYELARNKDAVAIAKKLGIERIKNESLCLECHFTVSSKTGEGQAIAGVSCESCHSAGKNFYKTHNDYGGKGVKKQDETADHKQARLDSMKKAGMIRHNDVYELVENCYQCHLTLNEKLVNVGGHKAGSDFELISWSQGGNRHNFFRSEDGKVNVESSPERKRVLYVIGAALDLEFSLRGLSKATTKGDYAITLAKRIKRDIAWLETINGKIDDASVATMIASGSGAKLSLSNQAGLLAAADAVRAATHGFIKSQDGSKLAALDELVPTEKFYKKR
jgi:hypothetical protein